MNWLIIVKFVDGHSVESKVTGRTLEAALGLVSNMVSGYQKEIKSITLKPKELYA